MTGGSRPAAARLGLAIATCGYLGFVPVAPGTFGSAAGLALFLLLAHVGSPVVYVGVAVLLFALGVWGASIAERELGRTDPGLSLEAPLFLLLLGAFAFGLVVGCLATWIGQGKWRRLAREETRQARDWRRQADPLEKELEGTDRSAPRAQLPAQ